MTWKYLINLSQLPRVRWDLLILFHLRFFVCALWIIGRSILGIFLETNRVKDIPGGHLNVTRRITPAALHGKCLSATGLSIRIDLSIRPIIRKWLQCPSPLRKHYCTRTHWCLRPGCGGEWQWVWSQGFWWWSFWTGMHGMRARIGRRILMTGCNWNDLELLLQSRAKQMATSSCKLTLNRFLICLLNNIHTLPRFLPCRRRPLRTGDGSQCPFHIGAKILTVYSNWYIIHS